MRRLAVLSLLVVASAVCAQDKAKDLIVGTWVAELPKDAPKEAADLAPTVEFKKDGALVLKVGPLMVDGKYKFLSDDQIEVEIDVKGQKQTQKLKVAVTKDTLTTTDEKAKVEKFKRKS